MAINPFKPTAGKLPPILIGRQAIIDDFRHGLLNGAGAPERLMLLTGQRGYGKTVMLTELGKVALQQGWELVSETATAGMCERMIETLTAGSPRVTGADLGPSIGIGNIASLSLGHVDFSIEQQALTLRSAINERLKKLPPGRGICFSIDEAQAASLEDMTMLATTVQHVIRDQDLTNASDKDQKGIALVFAALPSLMDDLLNDKVLTFLRRAVQRKLGPVPIVEVKNAFITSITHSGKQIDTTLALHAAQETFGYPYMVQLVGYYMWQAAESRRSQQIEETDFKEGLRDAVLAFEDAVCAPAFKGLTLAQQSFVMAMLPDQPHASKVADIAERVHKSQSWVSKYRASLIDARVIESAGYGRIRFAVPYLVEYLIKQDKCQHQHR